MQQQKLIDKVPYHHRCGEFYLKLQLQVLVLSLPPVEILAGAQMPSSQAIRDYTVCNKWYLQ